MLASNSVVMLSCFSSDFFFIFSNLEYQIYPVISSEYVIKHFVKNVLNLREDPGRSLRFGPHIA